MLRNRLYYAAKPLVPRAVRRRVRSWWARRVRERFLDTWPVAPGSERPPEGWPGWPEGKQFALVLTHDVEGQAGLDKCRRLVELEMKLGFRSSVNLVPEGEYSVPSALRLELVAHGFEVGVHDLYHDGRLFLTRKEFRRNSVRINQYLTAWGAVGFRGAFMLRNLDWLHDLRIQYDLSTFDTDPFEPQPEGQNTIFPFWVPRPPCVAPPRAPDGAPPTAAGTLGPQPWAAEGGYAELPYTLVQDSTLFLLLGERHPDIWIQKLDWVARQGGMALLNTHPDYMGMEGASPTVWEYSVGLYQEFLEYARSRYGGRFWPALPQQVARFVGEHRPKPPRKPKRICMVTYSHYVSDTRVIRYAEALAERGDHVDVLNLRRSHSEPTHTLAGKVDLFCIQTRAGKRERSPVALLFPILRFFVSATARIACLNTRQRYDLLHIHNVPDFLVFAGWLPKLTGAKVILDIHDLVPEFYANKFDRHVKSQTVAMLKWAERVSARFANHVIISNHLWRDRYAARTGADRKCSVFINNVDGVNFRQRPRTRADGKHIILFPGGLQWHQGVDIAIRAFQKVHAEMPTTEFHIYGEGIMRDSLGALAAELGLQDCVRFFDPLPVSKIADVMANADVGVVPKRADSFGNEAYSTKIMEFMSVGVPVIVSDTKIDRYYFPDSTVRFFESGNPAALAAATLEVLRDADRREEMIQRGLEYAALNNWQGRRSEYLRLVDELCAQGSDGAGA